jgi:hypothetical protein
MRLLFITQDLYIIYSLYRVIIISIWPNHIFLQNGLLLIVGGTISVKSV